MLKLFFSLSLPFHYISHYIYLFFFRCSSHSVCLCASHSFFVSLYFSFFLCLSVLLILSLSLCTSHSFFVSILLIFTFSLSLSLYLSFSVCVCVFLIICLCSSLTFLFLLSFFHSLFFCCCCSTFFKKVERNSLVGRRLREKKKQWNKIKIKKKTLLKVKKSFLKLSSNVTNIYYLLRALGWYKLVCLSLASFRSLF